MRLIYLSSTKPKEIRIEKSDFLEPTTNNNEVAEIKIDTINQIKNVTQEKKTKPEMQSEVKGEETISINSFDELLKICSEKKEIKLKYELEKNVNLVSFEKNRIEISFNDNLDKNFVKDLSSKLFEWTNQRWIITFSKTKGEMSIKDKEQNFKIEVIKKAKKSEFYKVVLEKFPDADLVKVESNKKDKE